MWGNPHMDFYMLVSEKKAVRSPGCTSWETTVHMIMRETIKCGKDFLSLGLLIPEIKLDWLLWKDSITTVLKRDSDTKRTRLTQKKIYLP